MINVDFIGRLGADSEIKTTSKGGQYLTMRVATDGEKDSNGNRETIWMSVVYFPGNTEKMAQYLKKGSHVHVHGTLKASAYTNREGNAAVSIDVVANAIEFVSSGSKDGQQSSTTTTEASTGTFQPKAPEVAVAASSSADVVDDLPF